MRRLWFRCNLPVIFFFLALVLLYVSIFGPAEVSERPRFIVEYGINCSAIYDMEPAEVGKSLVARRKSYAGPSDKNIVNGTSDCDWFLESKGFDAIRGSEFEREFPLAYSLVVHKNADLVERLLRAIYMPHNVYCIHYDLKSSHDFKSAMQGLARCLPNVFIASKLERVQYAGISRLKADLNCLSDLLESEVKWKYVINLCGQDFPLRTNAELVSDLKMLKGKNMVESKRSVEKEWRWRFHHILKNEMSDNYELPINTNKQKPPAPHSIEMFVGSAYFTISREFVLFIQSPLARDFLVWSEDTYSPDEHFWATLVRVPGAPGEVPRSDPDISELHSKTRLVKWSYFEDILYPSCTGEHVRSVCVYGAAELRWLLNFGHWFANKVDPKVDPILIECLEEKLLENSPLARDFLVWSEDTYSPDEHFWATLVRVPGALGEVRRSDPDITELTSKTCLVKWFAFESIFYPPCTGEHVRSVCVYGAGELRWILNYGHWFANKVDPNTDPILTEYLEERLL